MDLEDRQASVAFGLGLGFAIVLPVLTLLGCLLAMGWCAVLGVHDVHGAAFGWLSDKTPNKRGGYVYGVGPVVWQYYLGLVSTYIAYQLSELTWGAFKAFRAALT